MTDDAKNSFQSRLQELVGKPTGSGKPSVAPDPVNQPMIRHWAYALEDMNPIYIDPEFAATSRFGGIVSPPVMLQTWTMPPPKLTGIAERGGVPIEITNNPMAFLDEAGYTGTSRLTRSSRSNDIPRLGDVITSTTVYRECLRREENRIGNRPFCHLGNHLRRSER